MAHPKLRKQQMLEWLTERLGEGQPCPTDAEIGDRFGFTSAEHARTLLADLSDAGSITIRGWGPTGS